MTQGFVSAAELEDYEGYKTALELIANGFPGEEFDGSSEQVERAEQAAREALGWHWHVTFKDWRDSPAVGNYVDGRPCAVVLRKSVGVPLYDDMPPLFLNESAAADYARNITSDAVNCATMSREGQEALMAAREKGGILLPRVKRSLSAAEFNEARASVDAKVVDCREPKCRSFAVARRREIDAERLERMRREVADKAAQLSAADERAWRAGTREKVK